MKIAHLAGLTALAAIFAFAAAAQGGKVPLPPAGKVYMGVSTIVTPTPTAFEKAFGLKVDIIQSSMPVPAGGQSRVASLQQLGGYSIVSLPLAMAGAYLHETITNDGTGLAEKPDDFYKQWADAAKAFGKPMLVRWGVEMNHPGFPTWCVTAGAPACVDPHTGQGQTPADFVAAWRHIHDIFQKEGATNVSWVWCPRAEPDSRWDQNYSQLPATYPGDAYVDWTCIDVYNEPVMTRNQWLSFDEILTPALNAVLAIAPNKPVIIGETNSVPGQPRPQWFAQAFSQSIPSHPQIRAVVIWQIDHNLPNLPPARRINWMIEADPATVSALKPVLQGAPYNLPALGH